jgi:ubiquinone/menaquinone biosynthesis C-methylase UbiE
MRPALDLYGLDLSQHSIRRAERNLKELVLDLRVGSIEKTSYDDDTFDIVTCASSMSYWENPVACFNEVHRILKPGEEPFYLSHERESMSMRRLKLSAPIWRTPVNCDASWQPTRIDSLSVGESGWD